MAPERRDHRLQVIAVLARATEFIALDRGGDLQVQATDEAGDLLGLGALDALLDLDDLPGVAQRRHLGFALVHALHADAPLRKLGHHHLDERLHLEGIRCAKPDLELFQDDLRVAALEVEPGLQFLLRLVDGVLHLHRVHLRYNVKAWHAARLPQRPPCRQIHPVIQPDALGRASGQKSKSAI